MRDVNESDSRLRLMLNQHKYRIQFRGKGRERKSDKYRYADERQSTHNKPKNRVVKLIFFHDCSRSDAGHSERNFMIHQ